MKKLLLAARKGGWNLADQILSALSNVVVSIVIANAVDATDFGRFAIAFTVFGIGIAMTRTLVGQPLQIRYAAKDAAAQHDAMKRAHGLAVLLGALVGLVCIGAGLVFGGTLGACLIALGVCFPLLLLQDSQRLTFFAIGRAWGAVVIDAVWNVVLFATLAVLLMADHRVVEHLVLAWGLSAGVGAAVGVALLRAWPRVSAAWSWVVETRGLIGYLSAEYVLGLGASQVSILLVAVIATEQAVGSLRAAQTLLGPVGILGMACFGFLVPEIARRAHLDTGQRRLAGFAVSGLLGVGTLVYVTLLAIMPDEIGELIFSDSWAGAASVIFILGLSSVFSGLAVGLAGVLYGLGRARETFYINMAKAPVILVAVLGGAHVGGAIGAAAGMAFAEAFVLPLWYLAFRKAIRLPPVTAAS